MAFAVMQDGTTKTLTAEQGLAVWQVLNCEKEPENEKQERFCSSIKRIYLNKHNAPLSYLIKFPVAEEPEESDFAKVMGATNVSVKG